MDGNITNDLNLISSHPMRIKCISDCNVNNLPSLSFFNPHFLMHFLDDTQTIMG